MNAIVSNRMDMATSTYIGTTRTIGEQKKEKKPIIRSNADASDSTGLELEKATTPKVGPTNENAEKLEVASNPFKRNGSHAGSKAYKDLDKAFNYGLIDWTTGQLKTPFLSATMKTEENS